MKAGFLYISLFLISFFGYSQNRNPERASPETDKSYVAGKIIDAATNSPIEYATIAAYLQKDSSLVGGTVTKNDGGFMLELKPGKYYLQIEFISYKKKIIPNVLVDSPPSINRIEQIKMSASAAALEEVEIVGEKSRMQIDIDKKVFNVEKDISNIGGSAVDAMENIPSVDVDVDGNINLRGSGNVRILIDGKPSGLIGISGPQALEQIPANTIESIEIITNPSARYDSEGMAGIINIILKKDKERGFNGLVTLTTSYPHDHQASINFNYGKKAVNLFGGYSLNYEERPGLSNTYRETYFNDSTTIIDQKGTFTRGGLNHNLRLGSEFQLTKKSSITVSGVYKLGDGTNERTTDYNYLNGNKELTSLVVRESIEKEPESGIDGAFNYRKTFDKKGQLFTLDYRYSNSKEIEDMDIEELYYDENRELLEIDPLLQNSFTKESQINHTASADYIHPIGKNGKFETGAKYTYRFTDKDFNVEEFNDNTQTWDYLTSISNHFLYNETVYAGYGIFSNKIKKFGYQLGLRLENATINTELKETSEKSELNYLNLFPTVHLAQELKKQNTLQLSYSRRIERPSLWSLNPFNSYSDPLNFWIGNPNLQPELTHSMEIGHVKFWEKGNLTSSIYYRHTDGVIQRIRTIDTNGVSITRPENLSSKDDIGVEFTFSKNLTEWWAINGSANYFRSIIDGSNVESNYFRDFYTWTGRVGNNLSIPKLFEVQVMFNYRAPTETPQGARKAMYFLDIALSKDVLKNKGTLSFKVKDVFNSRIYQIETFDDEFYVFSQYRRGVRTYSVSFSYRFNGYKPERKKGGYEYEGGEEF